MIASFLILLPERWNMKTQETVEKANSCFCEKRSDEAISFSKVKNVRVASLKALTMTY